MTRDEWLRAWLFGGIVDVDEPSVRTSLCCRVCGRGWMGEPGDTCAGCGRRAIVTGRFASIDLPRFVEHRAVVGL